MLNRFATLAAVCMLVPVGTAPLALADPAPPDPAVAPAADAGPPPDNGVVASEVPGIAHTQDGRTLTVSAKDETQLPVAPLTTALSSRDWLVGGTFLGNVTGSVKGGTLEAGYQIGCGIAMDKIKLNGSIGIGGPTRRWPLRRASHSAWRGHVPDTGTDRGGAEARRGHQRSGGQENVQGHEFAGHAEGYPHQDRQLRRRVVVAFVRRVDQFWHGHRRHRRVLRRHEDVLMTVGGKLAETIAVACVLAVSTAVAVAADAAADPPPPVPADPAAPAQPVDPAAPPPTAMGTVGAILGQPAASPTGFDLLLGQTADSRGTGQPAGRAAGFECGEQRALPIRAQPEAVRTRAAIDVQRRRNRPERATTDRQN